MGTKGDGSEKQQESYCCLDYCIFTHIYIEIAPWEKYTGGILYLVSIQLLRWFHRVNSKQKPSDTTSEVSHKSPLLDSSRHTVKNQTSEPTKAITTLCHLLPCTHIFFLNVIFFSPGPALFLIFMIVFSGEYDIHFFAGNFQIKSHLQCNILILVFPNYLSKVGGEEKSKR